MDKKSHLWLKKMIVAVSAAAMTLLISAPASGRQQTPVNSIKIVTPKWESQTNENGTGLFFEIIQNVYEPAGIKMTYHFAPWKRAQTLVNSKLSDAMLCVWEEHAREEKQIIPRYPMFIEHTAVIFKKNTFTSWNGIQSLNGKSAVWLRGYDYHQFKQFGDISLKKYHEVDSYEKAWMHLALDRYEVYIDALIDIDIYIRDNSVDMRTYQKEILWAEKAYIAFSSSKNSEALARLFDERIKQLFKTGKLQQIYEKWGVAFHPEYWEQ